MAIVQIGAIPINPSVGQLTLFPSVSIPANAGKFFALQTLPNPVPLSSQAYFLIIPVLTVGNVQIERPVITKWFPKDRLYSFKYSTPRELGDPIDVAIGLFPITPFGNFPGSPVNIGLFYDDVLIEPPALVV